MHKYYEYQHIKISKIRHLEIVYIPQQHTVFTCSNNVCYWLGVLYILVWNCGTVKDTLSESHRLTALGYTAQTNLMYS